MHHCAIQNVPSQLKVMGTTYNLNIPGDYKIHLCNYPHVANSFNFE